MSARTAYGLAALCTLAFCAYIVWLVSFYFTCDGVVVQAVRFPPYACVQVAP